MTKKCNRTLNCKDATPPVVGAFGEWDRVLLACQRGQRGGVFVPVSFLVAALDRVGEIVPCCQVKNADAIKR